MDGTVLPCGDCNLVMGNLYDNSLEEIWNGPAYRAFRRQTWTRAGLRALGRQCDCAFCCHVLDNARVHRFFKWVAPFCRGERRGDGGMHAPGPDGQNRAGRQGPADAPG